MATKKETIEKLSKMIHKVKVAMLVTMGSDGKFRSRPMTTQERDFDGDLWFFVSSDADVVKEIEHEPEVNVAYSEDGNFVSVSGIAEIVTDDQKKRDLWHPELKVWFEGKEPEDAAVLLIKVSASEAAYWESGDGAIGNAVRTVKALLTGNSANPIESGHTKFSAPKASKAVKAKTAKK
jgi:general stress protein 26